MIPSKPRRITIFEANVISGDKTCFVSVDKYWPKENSDEEAAWFFAKDSTFEKYYGHPDGLKTKMRLNDNCQIKVPDEWVSDIFTWIHERIQEVYGPGCRIEERYRKK